MSGDKAALVESRLLQARESLVRRSRTAVSYAGAGVQKVVFKSVGTQTVHQFAVQPRLIDRTGMMFP